MLNAKNEMVPVHVHVSKATLVILIVVVDRNVWLIPIVPVTSHVSIRNVPTHVLEFVA